MILAFNNKILSVGTKLLGNDSSPTPVVDDELLISTDTVTTSAAKSGGIIWYSNSSPITYSGNNRYVVHKITLSNAHVVINHGSWTEDTKSGQIQQQIFWNRPTGEQGYYGTLVGVANITSIDNGNYMCGGRTSSTSNPPYAYKDWTNAYNVSMLNSNNPVIFRFIVDRATNKVNVYCTRVGPYATYERLIYDANMVVDGTNSMLRSPSSISPYSTTAENASETTFVYADAKYEMHACSSFDVAIAC